MQKKKMNRRKFLIIILFVMSLLLLNINKSDSQLLIGPNPNDLGKAPNAAHWEDNIPCLSCHMLTDAPGTSLTAVAGNANLCMSCHNYAGMASSTPFSNADRAIPGIGGTSHSWNTSAINTQYGANFPSNYYMAEKVMDDEIVCSTCHNPHGQFYPPFLRTTNDNDVICKDCHSIRDVQTYLDDSSNLGSHPVGIDYPISNPAYHETPQNTNILLINSRVECRSCHGMHYATSGETNGGTGDGYLLRATNDDNLCSSCHTYVPHQGMGCTTCHQPHNTNLSNIYLVRDNINTPNSGPKPVTFLAETGTNSFADGDATYDGICEACHTLTDHFRNDGLAPDQNHSNWGTQSGNNCMTCHSHTTAFAPSHGDGGSGTGCEECHGHDEGYEYSPGLFSEGKGSSFSHSAHTENDADDLRGPNISCNTCHDANNFPNFISGTDANSDNRFDLQETDVCDNCHSPNGAFDGVNDTEIGAKNNWSNGVYAGNELPTGKEKWCAGCHDNGTSTINGITAPPIAGDDASWGYFSTGHGKNSMVNCSNCHDLSLMHTDGNQKTFQVSSLNYQTGFRLKLVNGEPPLTVPISADLDPYNVPELWNLCFSCHNKYDLLGGPDAPVGDYQMTDIKTNFRKDDSVIIPDGLNTGIASWSSNWWFTDNTHYVHLDWGMVGYDSDQDDVLDSRFTCITCHNIHGSTSPAMMRDGKLLNKEPGLGFEYVKYERHDPPEAGCPDPIIMTSDNVSLSESQGGIMRTRFDDEYLVCWGCHLDATSAGDPEYIINCEGNVRIDYYRDPIETSSCTMCHNQPPDGNGFPNTAGSHETHLSDLNGPQISDCFICHAGSGDPTHMNTFTSFTSGTDINSNGNIELSETDVCDNCHSSGGSYDGVDDPDIGAKSNWQNGVYTGSNLATGKEKWCAGCHDETPANSMFDGTGINAPMVIGDESASYIYGTGYGFYKTGHGLQTDETYPASGGVTTGAGLTCSSCHDLSSSHIDHNTRTFDDGNITITDPGVYRTGYRLKLVGGLEPMQIPLPQNTSPLNNIDQSRLCYSCHDSGPFLNSSNMNTNLVTNDVNRHAYHLGLNQIRYSSDWDGNNNSRITCVNCHNVHGSKYLTMVRDGELIDSVPGLKIWYNNDDITSYVTYNPDPPDPENVSLAASTGTIWSGGTSSKLCTHCHGSPNTTPEYRNPFQEVNTSPWLEWVGDLDFENDGVNPNTSLGYSTFLFRVNYFDNNNDVPSISQLLVDTSGDGVTDTIIMTPLSGDNNFTDASAYSAVVKIARPVGGPGNVDYRFNFISTDSIATGDPTTNHQFFVGNNLPVLDWSANTNFETDGVHPNIGPVGDFNFEVLYTDADGDVPSSITLVIDDIEPGYEMIAGAGDIKTGRVYTSTQNLSAIKNYNYRFIARDNDIWGNYAILESNPLTNHTFTLRNSSNNIPTLSYVSQDCFTNSLMPARGPVEGDYDFSVVYTDLDDDAPASISVFIDNTDEYVLAPISGDIPTGRTYGATIQLNDVGNHAYHFSANDGQDDAIGDPSIVGGNSLEVVNALKVKPNDTRPGWYGTIQEAINAFSDTLIMVYPATYNEKLSILYSADDKLTLEAICGPENTIIDSTGNTIFIQNMPTYTKIIGFTITGGTNGFYINNGDVEITNCIIRNNSNRGIASGNPGNNLTITNTIIRDNNEFGSNVNGDGGGIMLNGGTWHVISGCVISNNHSSGRGGGIFVQNITTGNLTLTNTEVSNNTSVSTGGGIGANVSNLVLINSKVISNTSTGGAAGAFYVQGSNRTLDIRNSIIAHNSAIEAGGIWLNMLANVSIANSVFTGNRTFDTITSRGGAIYTNINCFPVITNSIFWNNEAGRGDDIYAHQSTEVITFRYCNFVNNGDKLFGSATFDVDASNIWADPRFMDEAIGDYRLMSISPCIDQGTSLDAPFDDITGESRGADGRSDGNVTGDFSDYDIGAYEFIP